MRERTIFRRSLPSFVSLAVATLASVLHPAVVHSMNLARQEARIDSAVTFFGVTGKGVLVAILDRGIDWKSVDFRKSNGTTRIQGILDLTDDSGAFASNNPYGMGTLYTRGQIDSANSGLIPPLATRDAVGHGTTTAGIICGSGTNSAGLKYRGVAPEASLLVIKLTSDGAPAHDSVAAEAPYYDPSRIPVAITYAKDRATALHMPCVMLLNLGAIGGPTDGTSAIDRTIDASFGAGNPGLVFVNGTGDDGGAANHAGGVIAQTGNTASLHLHKGIADALYFDLWYSGSDLLDVTVVTPSTTYGPYASPATNDDYDIQFTPDFYYYHYGGNVTAWGTTSGQRNVYLPIIGPAGDYTIQLYGSSITTGRFDATLDPARLAAPNNTNVFTNLIVPGSVGDFAACLNSVIPTDYNVRTTWTDIDGIPRSLTGEGNVGQLWLGSSVGPTFDGRLGVDVAAPGNSVFTTYSPTSYWHTFRFNLINDGGGLYGRASAVSAANPIVTGIVALMLQRNPNLDATQVRQILRLSARADANTGAVPNTTWGYGKVNAYAAMQRVIQTLAVPAPSPAPSATLRLALAVMGAHPIRSSAEFGYTLPREGEARLAIMDLEGRTIARLVHAWQGAGAHRAAWRPRDVPSGVYFAQLTASGASISTRVVFLK